MALTFFQRHFTRPVDTDSEKANNPQNRRFAFASRGFIATAVALLLVLIAAIAATVAVTVLDKQRRAGLSPYSDYGRSDEITSPGPASTDPVKLAIDANFPDPDIQYYNGTWYAWGTNSASGILQQVKKTPEELEKLGFGAVNVQLAVSKDFSTWEVVSPQTNALPTLGAWAVQGFTSQAPVIPKANVWAPSVIQRPSDSKWVMYYSATLAGGSLGPHHSFPHCTGAAISNSISPNSTFVPQDNVLFCPEDGAGAIDPAGFIDTDKSIYVAYKIDGNSMGHGGSCGNMVSPIAPTPIMLQKMEADGITKSGDAKEILNLDHQLDGPLIEAPSIVRSHEGIYFLFFSSGCTRAPTYDIKYATAKSVTGPYTRAEGALLETGSYGLLAPGSSTVVADGSGGYRMAFHGRRNSTMGGIRAMYTAGITFEGDKATLEAVQQKTA